jgi:hypothetical protein
MTIPDVVGTEVGTYSAIKVKAHRRRVGGIDDSCESAVSHISSYGELSRPTFLNCKYATMRTDLLSVA